MKIYCSKCRVIEHDPKPNTLHNPEHGHVLGDIPTCAFCAKPADAQWMRPGGTINDWWCNACITRIDAAKQEHDANKKEERKLARQTTKE